MLVEVITNLQPFYPFVLIPEEDLSLNYISMQIKSAGWSTICRCARDCTLLRLGTITSARISTIQKSRPGAVAAVLVRGYSVRPRSLTRDPKRQWEKRNPHVAAHVADLLALQSVVENRQAFPHC